MDPDASRFRVFDRASIILAALFLTAFASAQSTRRVSVDTAGVEGNRSSEQSAISSDGQFIAFWSYASNLTPGDVNGFADVFVHDRRTGQTSCVSVDSGGSPGDGPSGYGGIALSLNGRYVAFVSASSNLVPGDLNNMVDVFVHDRLTGLTTLASKSSSGAQANYHSEHPAISGDGRFVVFESEANNIVPYDSNHRPDVFVHDTLTGVTERASVNTAGSQGNSSSGYPAISAAGRYVAFASHSSNLVAGDLNGLTDVFVRDRLAGTTVRVSVGPAGLEGDGYSFSPSISSDGRRLTFDSTSTNLVAGDTNGQRDVFLHDLALGLTLRCSVDSMGGQANNLSYESRISADGSHVAFYSYATNLVSADANRHNDVFVHDTGSGDTELVSVASTGEQGSSYSLFPAISSDGGVVSFTSHSNNLVQGDTNNTFDVFVRDRGTTGLQLALAGGCPGLVRLTLTGATPGARIPMLFGAAGRSWVPNGRCAGTLLDISAPAIGGIPAADSSGGIVFQFYAPAGVCGLSVQALDWISCSASDVEWL